MMMDLVAAGLDVLHERIAGRFARSEPRARVREYVSGLVTGLERKNGWTLAEWAGEVSPDGMQRLLRRADWDVDGVRDDVRAYVVEHLGDPGGVLIADDTGFLKKGTRSAGVQRQYSGTAGRTENCQVGVFLAYASAHGHALIDRELYVPRSWTDDPERCRAAGPGDDRPGDHGRVPFAWFTADETYGQAKWLQAWLEDQDVSYVMAIRCARARPPRRRGHRQRIRAGSPGVPGLRQQPHRGGERRPARPGGPAGLPALPCPAPDRPGRLQAPPAVSTRARRLIVLRSFLRFAAREEWLAGDLGATIDVPRLPKRLPKPLAAGHRDRLCQHGSHERRNVHPRTDRCNRGGAGRLAQRHARALA